MASRKHEEIEKLIQERDEARSELLQQIEANGQLRKKLVTKARLAAAAIRMRRIRRAAGMALVLLVFLAGCCGPRVDVAVAQSAADLQAAIRVYVENSEPKGDLDPDAHRDLGDGLNATAAQHAKLALRGVE